GHHGANELARQIAEITGGHAAITTASEVRFGVNLESPAPGYVLANPENHKSVIAAMLRGEKLRHKGEAEWLEKLPLSPEGSLSLLVTEHAVPGSPRALVYHPKTIVIGAGCERNADAQSLIDLAETMLANEGLARQSVAAIASIDLKADETCIHALARHFNVPVRFFTAEELRRETARLKNPSETVLAEVGVAGVSEAAALALAGPTSELIAEKQKGYRVTAAIALAEKPITEMAGRAQGVLHVVGLGPGAPEWRSPAASQALLNSTEWVGYGLYLDLAEDLSHGEAQHRFPLGGEEARVRHAINLAADGKEVSLICSGDAGIYAMASLVFELLALEPSTIAVNVIPGISAFQAAAARAGALIGHDFCCISLSDLLTPWEVIERRVKAAAEGDFVVAFYNPRSLKRTD
ncbi:MAG: bifunctional cobalt-precorrin 5A hydrolase/precorrin-3B C(17)-methyltransferase, partial [Aestuariivirgaceae bacterium]|nr:bifunctional cobalt-precorrin 5A hydrolase/precorrin-3B C(17)-methyltransferase [Aestuariivirgaceae bacterium]